MGETTMRLGRVMPPSVIGVNSLLGCGNLDSFLLECFSELGGESRGGASVAEIRRGFDQRASVDAIESVKGSDLEITKDAGGVVISATYRKEIPLVANVGVYIEFRASSKE